MYSLNFCGCLVLFITSLPVVKTQSTKVVGLGFAMILLALGTGGVKATASPFIGNPPSTPEISAGVWVFFS